MSIELPEKYESHLRVIIGATLLYLAFPLIALLDISSVLCNNVIFPLVGIPKIKRKDYVRPFSRFKLVQASIWYRVGCVYCSYANGVACYFQVMAMKVEFLYCPWKQKDQIKIPHHRFFQDW